MTIRILALDTSTEACSAAILNDQKVVAKSEICPQKHTQKILPMIEQLISEAEIELNQLNAIAFSRGPGSFTGIRIGIGIAQGLALGCNIPLIPISTLMTLAQGAFRVCSAEYVLAMLDARMGEVYWGQYCRQENGDWTLINAEAVSKPEQIANYNDDHYGKTLWYQSGNGWQIYPEILNNINSKTSGYLFPLAQDMLPLALSAWQKGDVIAVENVDPIYLRNDVTWKKIIRK